MSSQSNLTGSLFHKLYNFTWLNVLRMAVLRAYFRRDFKNFDKNLLKIKPHDPEFVDFCMLFKNQLLEGNVTFEQWQELLLRAEKKKVHWVVHRKIYSEIVTKSIHDQNLDQAIQWLLKKNDLFGFQSADIGLSHGIIKLMIKQNRLELVDSFLAQIFVFADQSDWKEFIRIKLLEVTLEIERLRGQVREPLWEVALKKIETSNISGLIKSYFRNLGRVYHKIGQHHSMLLDVRTSPTEQAQLLQLIEERLIQKKSFSLIRLGDGESYGMESNHSHFKKDQTVRELKWWGLKIDQPLRDQLIAQFQSTVQTCDVIGIPGVFRFIRDAFDVPGWFSLSTLKPKTTYRGIQILMDDIEKKVESRFFLSKTMFVEHRCHQVLFTEKTIRELAKHATKVVIVSKYDAVRLKATFTGVLLRVIQIPNERTETLALPFRMEEFISQVSKEAEAGALVLVGAGFAGKYFLKTAKDQGAVALDVGAMVDYWAGFQTRQVVDIV